MFYEDFEVALNTADVAFTLGHLHPLVIDRYGRDQCEALLATTDQASVAFDVLGVTGPDPWDWELDGITTRVPDAWSVVLDRTVNGEPLEQPPAHVTINADGMVQWFTDCGEPDG